VVNFLSVALLGFFLGMRHATDPDHVVAVTTIVSREKGIGRAAWIGALWGLGHTLTIALVGGCVILFGLVIPPRIGLTMEFSVALMLILLGSLSLTGRLSGVAGGDLRAAAIPRGVHSHVHRHGDYVHGHPHGHGPGQHGHAEGATPQGWLDLTFGRLGVYHALRPVVVGIVHGLAGSAAVALLVLATIRDPLWATAYLFVFGLGTVAGMMLITAAISLPFSYTSRRFGRIHRGLGLAAGLVSLALGLFLAYEIGFVDGLFAAEPRWSPR
jgi:sulfite exporter TauE/SafE